MSKDNSSFLLETEELWRISAGGMSFPLEKQTDASTVLSIFPVNGKSGLPIVVT